METIKQLLQPYREAIKNLKTKSQTCPSPQDILVLEEETDEKYPSMLCVGIQEQLPHLLQARWNVSCINIVGTGVSIPNGPHTT